MDEKDITVFLFQSIVPNSESADMKNWFIFDPSLSLIGIFEDGGLIEQKIRTVHCSRTSAVICLLKKGRAVENKTKEKGQRKASLFSSHRWSNNRVASRSGPKLLETFQKCCLISQITHCFIQTAKDFIFLCETFLIDSSGGGGGEDEGASGGKAKKGGTSVKVCGNRVFILSYLILCQP